MLDSHPEILCHHEVFNPGGIHRSQTYRSTDLTFGSLEERDRDPWAFIRRIYAFTDGAKAVGFKIAPRDNDWALLALLLNRRVRKILLKRDNWLQAYTSGLIATETNQWSQSPDAKRPGAQLKVHVDPADFCRYAARRDRFYRTLSWLMRLTGQQHFMLDYTEIGTPATMRRLLAFLNVQPDHKLATRTAKQNAASLKERIENYSEVQNSLARTRFARMLD